MNPWAPRNKLCSPVTLHKSATPPCKVVTAPSARVPDPEWIVLGQGVSPSKFCPSAGPILHPGLSPFTTPLSCPQTPPLMDPSPLSAPGLSCPLISRAAPLPQAPGDVPCLSCPPTALAAVPGISSLDHPHPTPALAPALWRGLGCTAGTGGHWERLRGSDALSAMGRLWNALHGRSSALEGHRGQILGVCAAPSLAAWLQWGCVCYMNGETLKIKKQIHHY